MSGNLNRLFEMFWEVVIKNPLHSIVFFLWINFSGFLQIVSIGCIYPILNTTLNQGDDSNKLIKFLNRILGYFGLEENLLNYLLVFLSLSMFSGIVYVGSEVYQAFFLKKLEINERMLVVNSVLKSKWKNIQGLNHGDFINAITREVENYKCVVKYTFMIVSCASQALFFIVCALIVNVELLLICLGMFIISAGIYYPLMQISGNLGRKWTDAFSLLTSRLVNTAKAFKNIKSTSIEKKVQDYLHKAISLTSEMYSKQHILSASQSKISEFQGYAILAFILYYGVEKADISLPMLLLFLIVLFRLVPQIRNIIDSFHRAYSMLPSIIKMDDMKALCPNEQKSKGKSLEEEIKTIKLENISLQYNNGRELFTGLNLVFKKGEFWAINGATGSGKTSLLDVIIGIVEPTSGSIKYNEISQNDINIEAMHWRVGYLTQDNLIFSGTICQNIYWGNDNIDKSRLKNVLHISQMEDMVKEKTLDFQVTESGNNLSGGQKQRIAIARVLLRNYDFILMDEPTSALDKETGKNFVSALMELKGKSGIIMVTHRKEFLKCADHVLSIESGILKLNGKII